MFPILFLFLFLNRSSGRISPFREWYFRCVLACLDVCFKKDKQNILQRSKSRHILCVPEIEHRVHLYCSPLSCVPVFVIVWYARHNDNFVEFNSRKCKLLPYTKLFQNVVHVTFVGRFRTQKYLSISRQQCNMFRLYEKWSY